MPRFLANWEVETDIILPAEPPFLRYDHPKGAYTIFLRNLPEKRHDQAFLSMQIVLDAKSIDQVQDVSEQIGKEFLDHLSFVSNMKAQLRDIQCVFNWEPGGAMREALYYTRPHAQDDAPYEALDKRLLETIALLHKEPINPRLRRALKWFANGISSHYQDDKFSFFWFVIELIAQIIKEPAPVPDKCPKCHGPLHCLACDATPLHKPYPKQAVDHLFRKYVPKNANLFYEHASEARNMLMHGEEVPAIEAAIETPFHELVDAMGHLAWTAICNQFIPVLKGTKPYFLQVNKYVGTNVTAVAHMQVGFNEIDLANPDPEKFPKINASIKVMDKPIPPPAVQSKPRA